MVVVVLALATVVVVSTLATVAAALATEAADLEEWHLASHTVSTVVVRDVTVTAWWVLSVEQLVTSSVMVSST